MRLCAGIQGRVIKVNVGESKVWGRQVCVCLHIVLVARGMKQKGRYFEIIWMSVWSEGVNEWMLHDMVFKCADAFYYIHNIFDIYIG